jgi:rRNA maturation RNase YbeY
MPLQAGFLRQFVRREERGRNQLYLCDDEYLHKINLEYLNMMTTDIISFDYTLGNEIHGDIFISVERVQENAADFAFEEEIRRVMVHGVLHYCDTRTREKRKSY